MPKPVRLTTARVFDGVSVRLDPPPAGAVTADPSQIWQAASSYEFPVGSYELVLARYSSATPAKGGIPEFVNRLAWVVIGRHVPGVPSGGPRLEPGATTVPPPPCYFVTVLDVFDARNGAPLITVEGA